MKSLKDDPAFIPQLARLCGSSATDLAGLTTALKIDPTMKARFFQNINTAGANQKSTLVAVLTGK